jgi:hypothetical protein
MVDLDRDRDQHRSYFGILQKLRIVIVGPRASDILRDRFGALTRAARDSRHAEQARHSLKYRPVQFVER